MTESISTQDLEQFYSSQARVRNWVSTHAEHAFTSPNIPPSELDDDQDALSSPPSDAESSHSVPPRLVLRYPDGREFPIPHPTHPAGSPKELRSNSSRLTSNTSSHQRSRSGSTPSSTPVLNGDHRREREKLRSNSPEEIHILPSASDESAPPLPSSSHHTHSRSRSLPRDAFSPSRDHDPMPVAPSNHHTASHRGRTYEMPEPPVIPVMPSPVPHPGMARTQPAPTPWHPYGSGVRRGPMVPPSRDHFKHNPPSIVYAPSNNSHTNYHPPAILSYRPTAGPDRIFYSHSVPPDQAQIANAGYPSTHGSHAYPQEERVHRHKRSSESRHRDRSAGSGKSGKSNKSKSTTGRKSGRDRSHSLPLEQEYPPAEHHRHHHHHRDHHHHHHARPRSPADSDGSGSTYYVLPTAKQKVHILRSPDTLYTATSTTQSPTTPVSPTGSIKKPFLQRILGGFAERLSSSGSSKGSIRRRHSLTGARPAEPASGH